MVAARFPPFFRGHEAQFPPATQSFNIVPQFLLPKKFCQISLSFNITLFHNFSCQFYFYFKYLCPSTLFHNFPINNLSFKYIPPSTLFHNFSCQIFFRSNIFKIINPLTSLHNFSWQFFSSPKFFVSQYWWQNFKVFLNMCGFEGQVSWRIISNLF